MSYVFERNVSVDWADLQIILAVSRAGGAAAAGHALGVSHATVSRRISDIEGKLRIALVDRSGLSWKVTPLCRSIAEQAAAMEHNHAEALRLAKAFSEDLRGQVCISVPTGTIASFCARALRELPLSAPEISIIFQTEDEFADVAARKADLAVRFTNAPHPDLIGEKVLDSHWAFFSSTSIAEQIGGQQAENELPKVPLLASSRSGNFPDWAKGLFHPDCTCHFAYGFMEKAKLAEESFGVALLPRIVGDGSASLVQLEEIPCFITNELWVLANADTRSSQRISVVKKHLINGLKSMSNEF